MARFHRIGMILTALTFAALAGWMFCAPMAKAQSAKSKPKLKPLSASEVRQIDVRLEKLQETFETESTAIIEGFERSGQYERAKSLLEVILKLDPKNQRVAQRISELDDRILERTESERRFEVTGEWTLVGTVIKDKPARIEASGEYKLNLPAATLGPAGFPSGDLEHDLQPEIPAGALMGMIVTESNIKEKKPPPPFAIKTKYDFTPAQQGGLYLRMNLPPGSKSTGELKLKLYGIARS